MEKIFRDILDQFVTLNNFFDKKLLAEEDLAEEEKRYSDFLQTLRKFDKLFTVYKQTPMNATRAGSNNIMELHILMSVLDSFVQNFHDRVIDILKCYLASAEEDLGQIKVKNSPKIMRDATKKHTPSMEKIFRGVLDQLIILNNFLNKQALTESELLKEERSYDDVVQILKAFDELMAAYKITPLEDIQAGINNIKKLHILMDKLNWYILNLHERVRTIIRYYPVPDDM